MSVFRHMVNHQVFSFYNNRAGGGNGQSFIKYLLSAYFLHSAMQDPMDNTEIKISSSVHYQKQFYFIYLFFSKAILKV